MIPVVVVGLQIGPYTDDVDLRILLVPRGLGQPQRRHEILGNVVVLLQKQDNSCKNENSTCVILLMVEAEKVICPHNSPLNIKG